MGGWLDLTQQGLSPLQKHQTFLGVPIFANLLIPCEGSGGSVPSGHDLAALIRSGRTARPRQASSSNRHDEPVANRVFGGYERRRSGRSK